MGKLKIEHIKSAYSKLRISGLTRDPTPEDVVTALDDMEDMMSELSDSLDTGYQVSQDPDPNEDSHVEKRYNSAISNNLAVRLASNFNIAVHPSLMAQASQTMSNALAMTAVRRASGVSYPSRQPIGSGNRFNYSRWNRFYPESNDATAQANVIYINNANDFVMVFNDFIDADENIDTFDIVPDKALTIVSSDISGNNITYRATATDTGRLFVEITIITDKGRIETRQTEYLARESNVV